MPASAPILPSSPGPLLAPAWTAVKTGPAAMTVSEPIAKVKTRLKDPVKAFPP